MNLTGISRINAEREETHLAVIVKVSRDLISLGNHSLIGNQERKPSQEPDETIVLKDLPKSLESDQLLSILVGPPPLSLTKRNNPSLPMGSPEKL